MHASATPMGFEITILLSVKQRSLRSSAYSNTLVHADYSHSFVGEFAKLRKVT